DGRSVYDGSGIYPDIFIKPDHFANITQALVSKLLVFDYATLYRNTHNNIPDVRSFHLTDADFNDFVKYLSNKNYTYTSAAEKLMNNLKTEATKEKGFDALKPQYDALQAKMTETKKNDLQQNKDEIKQVLENEIVSRYYYEKGRYETNFKYDKDVAQAVKTMQDKGQLAAILNGDGDYKVIGKPQFAMVSKKAQDEKDNSEQ
ncbi:MAG: S41 family peptidase, partial [Mucilaginibacter sp.]